MAGKGTEVGRRFEEIAQMIDGVTLNDKLSVTFDTCHTSDAGYNIREDFDGVLNEFDHIIGLDRLKVIHLNDSKNPQGAHKDRHANIGFGEIGFDALHGVVTIHSLLMSLKLWKHHTLVRIRNIILHHMHTKLRCSKRANLTQNY